MKLSPPESRYDVFLSHNSADKAAVVEIGRRLRDEAGLRPFIDVWHLVPGEPWQEALENALGASAACAVFLGPSGFGTWENEEMRAALNRRVSDQEFRVIPVILPGASLPERGRLPPFLGRLTWVDFRNGTDDGDALDRLVRALRGEAPTGPDVTADTDDIPCPFRGLEVFDEEHADYYFGREALTQHLVERLRDDRFLAVIGPSGSGKSSLVRAGLVPQVRKGALPGSASWPVVIIRPGPHPIEALAARFATGVDGGLNPIAANDRVLAQLGTGERALHVLVQLALASGAADPRLLIVIDQFEELFTLCRDDNERARFVEMLLYASSVAGGQTIVVLAMRADFVGRCGALPGLAARLAERLLLVPPLEPDELRRAIELPAARVGLEFEKGLVDTILEDLGHEPGSLPLLQHTLLELFEGRRGRWLTVDRYRAIGRVRGAIAQRAEIVFARFTQSQQVAARRILLRLTQPGEGTEDTRRRAPVSELRPVSGGSDDVETVIRELADARLLITGREDDGGEVVDVAHEALIRGWPRLKRWIDDDPAALRAHRRLGEAATDWAAASRDPAYLYRGHRLVEATAWLEANPDDPSELERAFLDASAGESQREEDAGQRRMRLALGGMLAFVIVVSIAGVVALALWRTADAARVAADQSRRGAEAAAAAARSRYLVAEGLRLADDEPLLGLRLAVEGQALGLKAQPPIEFTADLRPLVARARIALLGHKIQNVVASPDGTLLLVDVLGGPAEIRRSDGGSLVATLPSEITFGRFAPALINLTIGGGVQGFGGPVLSVETPTTVEGNATPPSTLLVVDEMGGDPRIYHVDGSPVEVRDGLYDVSFLSDPAATVFFALFDAGDAEIRRVDDGSLVGTLAAASPVAVTTARAAAFWAVGRIDGGSTIVDRNGQQLRTTPELVLSMETPDEPEGNVVVCFDGRPAELWSRTGAFVASLGDRCGGAEDTMTFADDGRIVSISHLALDGSPEPQTLYWMSDGSSILVKGDGVTGLTVLDASTGLVAVNDPSGVELADGWRRSTITRLSAGVQEVAVVGQRAALAVLYDDGRVELRSSQTGDMIESIGTGFNRLDVSSEAPIVLASYFAEDEEPSTVRPVLRRIIDGRPARVPGDIVDASMGPAGSGVYFVRLEGDRTELRRQADDSVIGVVDGVVRDALWARDNSAVFMGDFGTVVLDQTTERLTELESPPARAVAFGSDAGGRWLLVAQADFRTSVWQLGAEPEQLFVSEVGDVVMQFDPTGSRLVVSGVNGTGYLVDLAWILESRGAATDLTAEEVIASACAGPLTGSAISPEAIERYLEGAVSACE